ncbi:hypothetical protein ABGB17_35335 [Sphaerisporangium sp. B11E5]|uniref:hypothetical protein n=1 Tax=Sphaerisporangium sp. B11E5 TaxID=3153563 RepID=UPI00325E9730
MDIENAAPPVRENIGKTVLAVLAAILTTLALAVVPPPALADPAQVCRLTIILTTGDDGIREDSTEIIRVGGRPVTFLDSDGDGEPDRQPFHRGGTGDDRNRQFVWAAELDGCADGTQLAQGVEFEHQTDADDLFADNWDLRELKIVDAGTGFVIFNAGHSGSRLHRFHKHTGQKWNTSEAAPDFTPGRTGVCRLGFVLATGFQDGIRDDSTEIIRLGGQAVTFLDSDGNGEPDPATGHRGGTGDTTNGTFIWEARLTPCVPARELVNGFEFEHISRESNDGSDSDNWDLAGLQIIDRDTGAVYFSADTTGDRVLNRFQVNKNRVWNTNQAWATSDSDDDGDGLFDDWERHGYDHDRDSRIDVNLPAMGADPAHKDVFLELDWEAGRAPRRTWIQAMKKAFAAAPADAGKAAVRLLNDKGIPGAEAPPNPDGRPGITLHVDTGALVDPRAAEGAPGGTCVDGVDNNNDGTTDAADGDCGLLDADVEDPGAGDCVPAAGRPPADDDSDGLTDAADPDCLVGDPLDPADRRGGQVRTVNACARDMNFFAVRNANYDASRRAIFHYGIMAARPGTCPSSSGGSGERGGNDFVVFNLDAGTIMHELGHNLNLNHGGGDPINCKPNYVSVMNYDLQEGIRRVGGGRILDYSPPRITLDGSRRGRAPLETLHEDNLSESAVLDPSDPANQFVFVNAAGAKVAGNLDVPPDWDPSRTGPLSPINVNTADSVTGQPAGCRDTRSDEELKGSDDWATISLPFAHFGDSMTADADAAAEPSPTTEQMRAMDERLAVTTAHPITLDVTGLTYPYFGLSGKGWWDTRHAQTLRLPAGPYTFVVGGVTAIPFRVTRQGRVDYDAPYASLLGGKGTGTLTLIGKTVTIDATALDYPNFGIGGQGWWDARHTQAVRLLPGSHTFVIGGVTAVPFRVTAEGHLDYDAQYASELSGRGTATLTVTGHAVTVDATGLPYSSFSLSGQGWWDARQARNLRLVAGPHTFIPSGYPDRPVFRVGTEGLVHYDSRYAAVFTGEGTTTLKAVGPS